MSDAWYNEIDPFAAAWLRELIKAGHIAPGVVDERDVRDVKPDEIRHFTQCHFFAGIGTWSYALRRAGWGDDRPVWTASPPCQPFSAAGARGGFADERHLWPHLYHLLTECEPGAFFGEQVASKDGLAWLDIVQADMEAAHYAFAALDLCSAGFGAPHWRQRLMLAAQRLADADDARSQGRGRKYQRADQCPAWQSGVVGELADTYGGVAGQAGEIQSGGQYGQLAQDGGAGVRSEMPGPNNGFWRAADWILCNDLDGPRWRPVEPGTFPLAHGAPARMGRLRGFGNGLNAEQAAAFIEIAMEAFQLDGELDLG